MKSMNQRLSDKSDWKLFLLLMICLTLSGCSGIAKGVTEAVLEKSAEQDNRKCYIRGRSFPGLKSYLRQQETATGPEGKALKVLMVHGIGSHRPGYSVPLAENLARNLELPKVQERYKEVDLANPKFPDAELGTLRVSRYLSESDAQQMLFYELTWDPIIEEEKRNIAYDNSGEYSFRRTEVNNTLKLFVNETVPDVVMYYGAAREQIQVAVGQSLCWMLSETWETLPNQATAYCDPYNIENLDRIQDDYAFITHSLGSRVTTDALQTIAALEHNSPILKERIEILRNKTVNVFMLSNQLPLLQLGQQQPEVADQIMEICSNGSTRAKERLFEETRLIAFSDPNDLLSYSLQPKFVNEKIDSRLCPVLTNVIIDVAPKIEIFGVRAANPMSAHIGYENDERVIKILSGGIGRGETPPLITERCEWTEVVP